jgi:drug/metabolite transporter (DMT)-like permease
MVHSQNTKLGTLFGFISALSFALMSVFVKLIGRELPVSMLIFAHFAISLILLMPWVVTAQHFSFKVQSPFRYILRILSALLALFFTFYAIKFIPLVDVLLLNNTSPLFVPIIAWFMTGAKTPHKAVAGIVLGFLGIAVILQPGQDIFSVAALFALLAGFLSAVAIVQMRLLSKESSILQMLFYYFAVSSLISGIATLAQWQMPSNMEAWLLLLAIGIFGTLYQVFATLSYAKASVRLMVPLTFLIVVFGGFFDWLIWGHTPTFMTIVGALLVIVGAVITIYFGQKELTLQQSK